MCDAARMVAEISQHYLVRSAADYALILVETGLGMDDGEDLALFVRIDSKDQGKVVIEDGYRVLELLRYKERTEAQKRFMERILRLHGWTLEDEMLSVRCDAREVVRLIDRMVKSLKTLLDGNGAIHGMEEFQNMDGRHDDWF